MKILDWQPRESACDYVTRVLLYNIVHLELAPGSEVSSTALSEELSVSRMPVRDALSHLSRLGLVEVLPQRGSYISRIDYDLVEESRFMRLVLEIAVMRQACEGVAPEYLDAMQENLAQYRLVQDDHDRRLEIDNEFHRLIFAAVDKSWTYSKLKDQMVHFDRLRRLSLSSVPEKMSEILQDHEDILYAIKRHDGDMGEMLLTRHLSRYQREIAGVMEQYPDYFTQRREKARQ